MTAAAVMPVPTQTPTSTLVELDLDDARWLEFVRSAPAATPFHHPEWGRLISDCYRYGAFVLAVQIGDRLVAGAPLVDAKIPLRGRRWISLPFTDSCAPLATEESALPVLAAGLERARRAAGVDRVEIRGALPDATNQTQAVTHALELGPDPDAVFARFKPKSVRHAIRQAERKGVTVRAGERREDLLDVFYNLHVATRRRLGTPVQPRRYFELLWERIMEPGLGFVLVAEAGDAPIAAAVFLTWNDEVVYKYSASDAAAWSLRPNNALLWHAIKRGCEDGCRRFDFGRSELKNDGLRSFKRSWGAEELPLIVSTLGETGAKSAGIGALGALGASVIRRSPAVTCRAAGALLYRYAA